jgi:hypothetical protein
MPMCCYGWPEYYPSQPPSPGTQVLIQDGMSTIARYLLDRLESYEPVSGFSGVLKLNPAPSPSAGPF